MKTLLKLTTSALLAILLSASTLHAVLLNSSEESQLESWLGLGDQTFTKIYTKQSGDLSRDFHSAVDNMGATFTLMTVTSNAFAGTQLIGGFNPQSWNSDSGENFPKPGNNQAFIYNLTTALLRTHTSDRETYNDSNWGPYFGRGADLRTGIRLNTGWAKTWSYQGGGSTNIFGQTDTSFTIHELEIYTFTSATPSSVPDSGNTAILASIGFLALASSRLRHKKQAS